MNGGNEVKKTLTILIVSALIIGALAACGDSDSSSSGSSSSSNGSGTTAAEEGYNQDFEFYNNTGLALVELRASSGGSDKWRANMLEGIRIEPGDGVVISLYITPGETTDFRVVAENGAEHELRGYQLEGFSYMELTVNDDGSAVILLN
jgi:hypothetical protein